MNILNIIFGTHCPYADFLTNSTLKWRINTTNDFIVYFSLSLNVCNMSLQCNLRFLSTTVLQGSVATRVNYGRIFNDFFIANLLLSVTVKEF